MRRKLACPLKWKVNFDLKRIKAKRERESPKKPCD